MTPVVISMLNTSRLVCFPLYESISSSSSMIKYKQTSISDRECLGIDGSSLAFWDSSSTSSTICWSIYRWIHIKSFLVLFITKIVGCSFVYRWSLFVSFARWGLYDLKIWDRIIALECDSLWISVDFVGHRWVDGEGNKNLEMTFEYIQHIYCVSDFIWFILCAQRILKPFYTNKTK